MIIGLGFCPWAGPAKESGNIRVVTSTSETGEGILSDLLQEAEALPPEGPPARGKPGTTLLVCPHVPDWEDFELFHQFYAESLENGDAFGRNFGMKIVAFHPDTQASDSDIRPGDEVVVRGPEGLLVAVVQEVEAQDTDGVDILSVEVQGLLDEEAQEEAQRPGQDWLPPSAFVGAGDLIAIRPLEGAPRAMKIRTVDVMWILTADAGIDRDGLPDLSKPSTCRSLIARAPRPILHLLRDHELDSVDDQTRNGVYAQNEHRLREVGFDTFQDLLYNCEE